MPFDSLLVETDSPYLTPHPFRGKTNEPARVALTAAKVAEIRRPLIRRIGDDLDPERMSTLRLPDNVTLLKLIPPGPPSPWTIMSAQSLQPLRDRTTSKNPVFSPRRKL